MKTVSVVISAFHIVGHIFAFSTKLENIKHGTHLEIRCLKQQVQPNQNISLPKHSLVSTTKNRNTDDSSVSFAIFSELARNITGCFFISWFLNSARTQVTFM